MKLTLHLQAASADTTASVSGDTLTHNGAAFDLSSVPEGGTAEPSGDHPFVGKITRENGEIQAAILWQYDSATAEPDQGTDHPVVTLTSGAIECPVIRRPEPEVEEDDV